MNSDEAGLQFDDQTADRRIRSEAGAHIIAWRSARRLKSSPDFDGNHVPHMAMHHPARRGIITFQAMPAVNSGRAGMWASEFGSTVNKSHGFAVVSGLFSRVRRCSMPDCLGSLCRNAEGNRIQALGFSETAG